MAVLFFAEWRKNSTSYADLCVRPLIPGVLGSLSRRQPDCRWQVCLHLRPSFQGPSRGALQRLVSRHPTRLVSGPGRLRVPGQLKPTHKNKIPPQSRR